MMKFLRAVVILFLIPCIVAEPAVAYAYPGFGAAPAQNNLHPAFRAQALMVRLTSFFRGNGSATRVGFRSGRRSWLKTFFGGFLASGGRLAANDTLFMEEPASDIRVEVSPDGTYRIIKNLGLNSSWVLQGNVWAGEAADRPPTSLLNNLSIRTSSDEIGSYQEISFDYTASVPRQSSIRLYYGDKGTVLFTTQYPAGGNPEDPFPRFTQFPPSLRNLSFNGWDHLHGYPTWMDHGSPFIFFDELGHTLVLSPAANFMLADMYVDNEAVVSDLSPSRPFDPGFRHQTMLTFGSEINKTLKSWGRAMTDHGGKVRTDNNGRFLERPPLPWTGTESDPSLTYLSYWTDARTDNGSRADGLRPYWYFPTDASQYLSILLAIPAYLKKLGFLLRVFQLDSWYYLKGMDADSPMQDKAPSWVNGDSGIVELRADPQIFPQGIDGFLKQLAQNGFPMGLITHARWWARRSPLRLLYKFSGGVPIDATYWKTLATTLKNLGFIMFEQDWLKALARAATPEEAALFLDLMAQAMWEAGIRLQYCMPLTRHFLQGSLYSHLTQIRVSDDGLSREHFDQIFYISSLASALGLWPYADNLFTKDIENLIVAVLTAGPFGIADPLDSTVAANLAQAILPDGRIVKPDVSAVPLDSVYQADNVYEAHHRDTKGPRPPMIASTYSDFGGRRAAYVFAYSRENDGEAPIHFRPSELGLSANMYVFDYFKKEGRMVKNAERSNTLSRGVSWAKPEVSYSDQVDNQGSYFIAVPVGRSGIAFLGDENKVASHGKQRLSDWQDDGTLRTTVEFAAGENSVVLRGYAPTEPVITVHGKPASVDYDTDSGIFHVRVTPNASGQANVTMTLSIPPPANTAALRRRDVFTIPLGILRLFGSS